MYYNLDRTPMTLPCKGPGLAGLVVEQELELELGVEGVGLFPELGLVVGLEW
jgi:hypothetical protein